MVAPLIVQWSPPLPDRAAQRHTPKNTTFLTAVGQADRSSVTSADGLLDLCCACRWRTVAQSLPPPNKAATPPRCTAPHHSASHRTAPHTEYPRSVTNVFGWFFIHQCTTSRPAGHNSCLS